MMRRLLILAMLCGLAACKTNSPPPPPPPPGGGDVRFPGGHVSWGHPENSKADDAAKPVAPPAPYPVNR